MIPNKFFFPYVDFVRYMVTIMRKVCNTEKHMPNFCDESNQVVRALVAGLDKGLALKVCKVPEFYKLSFMNHSFIYIFFFN